MARKGGLDSVAGIPANVANMLGNLTPDQIMALTKVAPKAQGPTRGAQAGAPSGRCRTHHVTYGDDGSLTLTIANDANGKASSTGKSTVLATSSGFLSMPDGSRFSFNWIQ